MADYYFMHKNRRIAAFSIENGSVFNVRISEKEKEFLPAAYGCDIAGWLKDRSIPVTRQGLPGAMAEADLFELMLANLGLSLTDTYWLNPAGSGYTWEHVNPYANDFKDTLTLELTDNRNDAAGKAGFLPSASLRGDLQKKWLIDETGVRMLVKGNYADTCIQSLSEVLASEIYAAQPYQAAFTPYALFQISSNGKEITGCRCPAFTNESLEFVPAVDIVNSAKRPNDKNYFQFYLAVLKEHGLDCADFYDMQIMADFVISNEDRHFNNFGVLRDTQTLRFVKPAPVFDSGNSMFYRADNVPGPKGLLDIRTASFHGKEVKLLSKVRNRGLLDTRYLPDADFVYDLFQKDACLPEEKRIGIVRAYERKIKFLEDFQNGADIWSYPYIKGWKY